MKRGTIRLLLGLLSLAAAAVLFASTFLGLLRGAALVEQFAASGTHTVQANQAGRFYVWNHYRTVFAGQKVNRSENVPVDLQITVQTENAKALVFTRDTKQSWSIGNHAKQSVGYVDVDVEAAGPLTIQIDGGSGEHIFSFGKADMQQDLWRRLRGFAFALVALLLGLAATIWGLIARRQK